jgi:F0F1-type ATP synthase assembly protein I
VGVGIGLIVDKYLGTKPFGLVPKSNTRIRPIPTPTTNAAMISVLILNPNPAPLSLFFLMFGVFDDLVVGVVIGLIVDKYLGTKPFGLIIFFIFGALAGFLNVYRVMRRIEKQ